MLCWARNIVVLAPRLHGRPLMIELLPFLPFSMASVQGSRSLRQLQCQPYPSYLSRIPGVRRRYHSYEHESPPPFTPTENAILSAGVAHVPAHGFTIDALTNGARDVGYRDVSVNLFPAGAFALVQHHLITQRLSLGGINKSSIDQDLGIAANIKKLAMKRLHGNKSIIHRWQEVGSP